MGLFLPVRNGRTLSGPYRRRDWHRLLPWWRTARHRLPGWDGPALGQELPPATRCVSWRREPDCDGWVGRAAGRHRRGGDRRRAFAANRGRRGSRRFRLRCPVGTFWAVAVTAFQQTLAGLGY